MEFDDLRTLWQEEQGRAEVRLESIRRLRGGIGRIWILLGLEILVALVTVGLAAAFLARHAAAPRFAVAGGLVLLFAAWMLAAGARQVALLAGLDLAGAVLEQQRRLEAVRVLRLRTTRAAFLVGLVGWVAFPVVAARALLGLDLIEALGPTWILANVVAGLVLVPVAVWLFSRRAFARFRDHVSGVSLAAALGAVERLRRFEAGG
jgi:hypothetical protein